MRNLPAATSTAAMAATARSATATSISSLDGDSARGSWAEVRVLTYYTMTKGERGIVGQGFETEAE